MKRKHIPADPCRDRSRRKQEALAFLASRGITQIRAVYPVVARFDTMSRVRRLALAK